MGYANFLYGHLIPNISTYILILLMVVLVFSTLYLQTMCTKTEFFFLWTCYFGEVFSIADVIFMYQRNLITKYYFINFVITTFVFFLTILIIQNQMYVKSAYRVRLNCKSESGKNDVLIKRYATTLFFLFVILSVLKIYVFGVRSFKKLGGGSGAIIRFLWIITPMLNFTTVSLFFSRYRKRSIIFLGIIVFFSFLGGSKSAVLELVFLFFVYSYLNPGNRTATKFIKKAKIPIILFGILCGVVLYGLLNKQSGENAFIGIFYRFIAFGDIYTFAYPDDVLRRLFDGNINFFQYLFSDFLATFRLADRSFGDEVNLSGILVEYIAGSGIAEGPNARFNVLGLAFFGYAGSVLFSVFCGIVFSSVHALFVKSVNKPMKKQMFAYVILNRLIGLEQDAVLIPQFFTEMTILLMMYPFLYIVCDRFIYHTKYYRYENGKRQGIT